MGVTVFRKFSSKIPVTVFASYHSDAKSISFVAHSIKGASGNLEFEKLFQIAAVMETRTRADQLDGLGDLILEMKRLLEKLEDSLSGR